MSSYKPETQFRMTNDGELRGMMNEQKQKTALELVDGRDPLQDIMEERARQDRKWGEQNHPNLYWLGVLVEEVGESAKAIIEDDSENIEKELVQVAAVAVAWLECIKRKGRGQK